MDTVPQWLLDELALSHPGIEIKWTRYPDKRKTFVLPVYGDAFHRMTSWRVGGVPVVMHRRHITPTSDTKWQLHPRTYLPQSDEVPDGRFVVFQTNVKTGELIKLFDVVYDDGRPHPLDRRVLAGINVRDGKHGAHDKAIADVEAAPDVAQAEADHAFEESVGDLFLRIHHDVMKETTGGANLPHDPAENEVIIEN